MSQHELLITYLTALVGRFRDDEEGFGTAELIVITGLSLLGAAAIGLVIWSKLRDGANGIDVPAPAAP